MSERISKISVSLSNLERKIVQRENKKRGLYNFSAALRQIIREWDDNQRGKAVVEEDPLSDAFNYSE